MSEICRVWSFIIPFLLICKFHGAYCSYAGSTNAIIDPTRVRQVSWKPRSVSKFVSQILNLALKSMSSLLLTDEFFIRCRAFVYEGFLTDLECDHLISIAKSELKRSAVADNLSGESKLSEVRTSSGMFISKNKVALLSVLLFLYLLIHYYSESSFLLLSLSLSYILTTFGKLKLVAYSL